MPTPQFNLGQAYRLGRGVPINLATAQDLVRARRRTGPSRCRRPRSACCCSRTATRPSGLKWLKQAAEQGEPRALLVYGTALFNGDGVTQDPVLGYAYVSRAAAQGLAPAKETLAQLDQLLPRRRPQARRSRSRAIRRKPHRDADGQAGRSRAEAGEAGGQARRRNRGQASAEAAAEQPAAAPSQRASRQLSPRKRQLADPARRLLAARQRPRRSTSKLSGKAALAGRQPFYVAAGAVTRLQVGPFASKAAAAAACKALGTACFPVPAK